MLLEIVVVLLPIVLNGFLTMSELAVVSAVGPPEGHGRARRPRRFNRLASDPGWFLSAAQTGRMLVRVLSGAFSRATFAGLSEGLAQSLGVGGVVIVITYLSLIVGELAPDRGSDLHRSRWSQEWRHEPPYTRQRRQPCRPKIKPTPCYDPARPAGGWLAPVVPR